MTGVVLKTLTFVAIGTYSYLRQEYPDYERLKCFDWIPLAAITIQGTVHL